MLAQHTITSTRWFEFKNKHGRSAPSPTNHPPVLSKVASADLVTYSGLPPTIMFTLQLRSKCERATKATRIPRTRCGDVLAKYLKQLRTSLLEASNIALDHSRCRTNIVAHAVSVRYRRTDVIMRNEHAIIGIYHLLTLGQRTV